MEKNYIITHEELETAEPAHHQGLQLLFMPYKDVMITGWWLLFALTSAVVLFIFVQKIYGLHKKR